jgi:23S rRNA (cytidine1920-2'-O)/16S rRNA (cytidine1409-2'-O)-methyltransferase
MSKKKRLDLKLSELYPAYSRRQIQSWIMQGKVIVNDAVITKNGILIPDDARIVLNIEEPKYVSRAGFKLEKALDHFNIDVTGLVALDAGLSTGGFSDCLLQRGIKKIYGVDVGYGQVHEKIRNDPRVVVMERTNLREVRELGEKVDLATLDLSFISVLKVMEAITSVMKDDGQLIVLIKPQFEAQKADVGRGGIIKDPVIHQRVIEHVTKGVQAAGFSCIGVTESPIEGATGNKEFLGYFRRMPGQNL